MIAANHPSLTAWRPGLGAFQDQTMPPFGSPRKLTPIRMFPVVPAPPGHGNPVQAKPNQITPAPEPPVHGEPVQGEPVEMNPVEIVMAQAPAVVPASASVAAPAVTDAASSFSLMDWLTEETLIPGYPNGFVGAGGVIALAWIFGGRKKGRR